MWFISSGCVIKQLKCMKNLIIIHIEACVLQRKRTMMHSGLDDMTKLRMLQAKALSKEARGGKCGCID